MIKVLIIEDEPLIAKMYQKALDQKEYEVTLSVGGGDEGFELAKTLNPNLILLDLMMPDPDGIEILKRLKAEVSTKEIPVVVLTNLSGRHDEAFARSLGALDYWVKDDIELEELGKKIKEVLQ